MKLSLWTWLACHVASTFALSPRHPARNLKTRATAASNHTAYYFDQAIDHFPQSSRYARHSNGKFKQRYFVETSYYKAGGPVFLYLAGEGPIDGDTHLDVSLITHLMEQFNGAGVVLENRYYGTSCPFNSSTTDELLYLTTEQVIADFDVFARKVTLPGLTDINAPSMPWILYGGSYPGALSAFTKKTYGDTFAGAISSSGVIHGQLEYPQWYDPIQLLAPQDCVASINDIVDNMDYLVKSNNTAAIQQLKELFGLGALKDIRDFAQTIAFPIGGPFVYPTYTWQEINWDPTRGHIDFFDFCRNVTDGNAPANNTEADSALAANTKGQVWKNLGNYAAYIKRVVLPLCPSGDYNSGECFGTQDTAHWANTTSNYVRSYLYTTCTEFGAYQSAQPYGKKSLISRVIDAEYTQEWCNKAFPAGQYNSIPATPDLDIWNAYGDFNFTAENLLFVDGTADPWKDLCYHSDLAPQRYWSDAYPQHLINGAGHVWDLRTLVDVSAEPQFIREATYLELRTVERWLKDFRA
ncbi:Uu.00g007040.m01.CDS01 [Anthostomella pinea]|uniref:Uu.00g007040.m01.CDS01 n=1 Tax=Anthostomella pinea TaxID=933095 RepID=A0AAI8VKG2_9PEZI|nr:Uu.00g007040.m01.CDS01 [Anthostomella pinea]